MSRLLISGAGVAMLLTVVIAAQSPSVAPSSAAAESRAVAFLTREVPRWKAENDCYSCHNNGDAARALIASARGAAVGTAIDDTLAWLREPARWDRNKTTGGIDDKPLARMQFASALARAVAVERASAGARRRREHPDSRSEGRRLVAARHIAEHRVADDVWHRAGDGVRATRDGRRAAAGGGRRRGDEAS